MVEVHRRTIGIPKSICSSSNSHETSARRRTLDLSKSVRIEPLFLARSRLPGRIVDYVIALNPDAAITHAWCTLLPLSSAPSKSWNHTTRLRHKLIAINIETKRPIKLWTDGKP